MTTNTHSRQKGFTLTEVMISSMVAVIAITMTMGGFVYVLKSARQSDLQNKLDTAVQSSMERLKYDLRLSSMDKMFFYPSTAADFTGISFPMATSGVSGAIELGTNGKIVWSETVIYHVWTSAPNQLRRTVFDPRDNSYSDARYQAQLDSVALWGNGSHAEGSANAKTEAIFENLFEWSIKPAGGRYDAYSATTQRDVSVNLGTIMLTNGAHTFRFELTNKNVNSSGYAVGVDTIYCSPSYSRREGEAQTITAQSGAVAAGEYLTGGSWSGNYHLKFPATAKGQSFTITMANDAWEETNFRGLGEQLEDTELVFDETVDPKDFVIQLKEKGTNWSAAAQTGDAVGHTLDGDEVRDCMIRVLLRGSQMLNGGAVSANGGRCRVQLRAGTTPTYDLKVEGAFIAKCSNNEAPSPDAAAVGTGLTFGGGPNVTIPLGGSAWSDWVNYPIEKTNSYLVTVSVLKDSAPNHGNGWCWSESNSPAVPGCYILPSGSHSVDLTDARATMWSGNTNMITTNVACIVAGMEVTYPTNGTYTSQIFDTTRDTPAYDDFTWNSVVPAGGRLGLKARTGHNSDMSDARAWSAIGDDSTTPGTAVTAADGSYGRYVQFKATFQPDNPALAASAAMATPKLKDFRISWPGEPKSVDIGGTFTRGPDYGIFDLTVDGQRLKRGINVSIEIYEKVSVYTGATNTFRSRLNTEVVPRNTGK